MEEIMGRETDFPQTHARGSNINKFPGVSLQEKHILFFQFLFSIVRRLGEIGWGELTDR
jgi:hypothetical protein